MKKGQVASWASVPLSLSVALYALGSAQPRPSGPPQQPIKVTTRLVSISVVVSDRSGNSVTGLTKEDFEVLDAGKPQTIAFFAAVTNQPPTASAPLPPDTYTNLLDKRGDAPDSVAAILFDTLNSRWTAQGYGLRQIIKFLRQIEPEDHIGLYVLTEDGLRTIHDFTQNATELTSAVERYDERSLRSKSASSIKAATSGNLELDRLLTGKDNKMNYPLEVCTRETAWLRWHFLQIQRKLTIAALQSISSHFASIPGRKSLIWVTDGLPIGPALEASFPELPKDDLKNDAKPTSRKPSTDRQASAPKGPANCAMNSFPWPTDDPQLEFDLERMVRLMNNTGIAIYPVSAEGLLTNDLGFAPQGTFGHLNPNPETHLNMKELAERTGGRAFYDRNDVWDGIRQAANDSRFTYSVSYYPDHNEWNGRFHKIQVKVKRPNMKVLAREGYFALPDPTTPPTQDRIPFLSSIAASPLEATQIPLTVHIEPSGSEVVLLRVSFNPESFSAQEPNASRSAAFEVVFFQTDSEQKILDVTTDTVGLRPGTYEPATQNSIELSVKLQLKPHATLLCVILHDVDSDSVGSVRIPIDKYLPAK